MVGHVVFRMILLTGNRLSQSMCTMA